MPIPGLALEEAVLDMLQVRSSDALAQWFARRLAGAFPAARRRVLRVYPGKVARNPSVPPFAVFSLQDRSNEEALPPDAVDHALAESIRSAAPLSTRPVDGGVRALFTLAAAGEVRYALELSGEFPPAGTDVLRALAAVASRYYERLLDSETDPLTRLYNRRAFHAHVESGLRRWAASGRAYFFAMLDIDHFKRVNDIFGHLYGDEILVRFAAVLRDTLRASDLIYRFGGEEFVVIFAADREGDGTRALERVRGAVERYEFPGVGGVTVSIGCARIAEAATPAAMLIDRADQAVYYAKAHGRNRVCSWEALVESGELVAPAPGNKDATLF